MARVCPNGATCTTPMLVTALPHCGKACWQSIGGHDQQRVSSCTPELCQPMHADQQVADCSGATRGTVHEEPSMQAAARAPLSWAGASHGRTQQEGRRSLPALNDLPLCCRWVKPWRSHWACIDSLVSAPIHTAATALLVLDRLQELPPQIREGHAVGGRDGIGI